MLKIEEFFTPKSKIKILDAYPGSGKSTAALELVKDQYACSRMVFVTPYHLQEHERNYQVLHESGFRIYDPKQTAKQATIKQWIREEKNCFMTHKLFFDLDAEARALLVDKEYVLIIDETPPYIEKYEGYRGLTFDSTRSWFELDETSNLLVPDPEIVKKITQPKYQNDCLLPLLKDGQDNRLACASDSYVKVLNLDYWKDLPHVFILTHRFDTSLFAQFLKKHGFEWEHIDGDKLGLKPHEECEYNFLTNLHLMDNTQTIERMNQECKLDTAFSKSWYKKATRQQLQDLQRSGQHLRKSVPIETTDKRTFYTTYKDYQSDLAGNGYKRKSKGIEPFLPMNTLAINAYREHNIYLYFCNVYLDPARLAIAANDECDRSQLDDDFATNTLIQAVSRGCIREGKPMHLILPSNRMRDLLDEFALAAVS